ncbi:MAG: NrdH-redoxin [Patescibacteria group bacterium]
MKKIIIYTAPWCIWCQRTKKFIQDLGYEFEERDVEKNQAWAEEMIKKTGQMGIPVTIIIDEKGNEKIVLGYDPELIKEYLKNE